MFIVKNWLMYSETGSRVQLNYISLYATTELERHAGWGYERWIYEILGAATPHWLS